MLCSTYNPVRCVVVVRGVWSPCQQGQVGRHLPSGVTPCTQVRAQGSVQAPPRSYPLLDITPNPVVKHREQAGREKSTRGRKCHVLSPSCLRGCERPETWSQCGLGVLVLGWNQQEELPYCSFAERRQALGRFSFDWFVFIFVHNPIDLPLKSTL